MARPVALVDAAGSPGTDLLASTAAALAAAGMALADDNVYATRLIVAAQQLYGRAARPPGARRDLRRRRTREVGPVCTSVVPGAHDAWHRSYACAGPGQAP